MRRIETDHMARVTVAQAIRRGLLQVYGPFFPCIVGGPLLALVFHAPDLVKGLSVLLGIGAAWLWWSYQVPRWRLWALRHVDTIAELHEKAVAVGIEWPYGSIFERTEIKPLAFQYEETIRSVRYYLVQLGLLFDPERDPLFAQAQASQVNRILTLLEEIPLDTASLLAALDALDHTLRQWYVQLPHGDVVTVASTLRAALHFMHRLQGLARKQARITYAA